MNKKTSGAARPVLAALAATAAVAAIPAVGAAPRDSGQTAAATDPAATLVETITREVKALPANASSEDIEAAIIFALSQANPPAAVIAEALGRLSGADMGQANFAEALGKVQLALLDKKFKRGTAAITDSGRVNSSFTPPSVNVGGGSTNYSN